MRPTQAVLFDLDGTVVDSIPLIVAGFRHALTVHRRPTASDASIIAGIGTPLLSQLRALADDDHQADAMMATYREFWIAHHDSNVRLFAGTAAMLIDLGRRAPLALVTSKSREGTERTLRAVGLTGTFAVTITLDDVEHAKPHPAPVQRALQALNVAPSHAWFVGDSPHDVGSGRAAGVRTAVVGWHRFEANAFTTNAPDRWLHSWDDLTPLLGADPP
jgi:pyrophosphatase PpaX